jgi:hypothetical protein
MKNADKLDRKHALEATIHRPMRRGPTSHIQADVFDQPMLFILFIFFFLLVSFRFFET